MTKRRPGSEQAFEALNGLIDGRLRFENARRDLVRLATRQEGLEAGVSDSEGRTIVMVEQNARKGLDFADIGYVLVSGQLAFAGTGADLFDDPDV